MLAGVCGGLARYCDIHPAFYRVGSAAAEAAVVKPRVVLVDDHELFLSGVRAELGDRVEIVGEAGIVADAAPVIREQDPDVVLLDVHLPEAAGRAHRSARQELTRWATEHRLV
jgi:DNA-binding NarL/FixJ family response regulator